jgi:AcrR family transcriptional regulator
MAPEARRRSILDAARRAFIETGDVYGTSIRAIAEKSGISEPIIYRHFANKEQLYFEAVVEPLRRGIDKLVAASEAVDRDERLTAERQLEVLGILYRRLIGILGEVLPLLGLVLFGDPKTARRFYREHLSVAMDELGAAWAVVEQRYGSERDADVAARAVMGTALLLALERHHNPEFDIERAIAVAANGNIGGFFPRTLRGHAPTAGPTPQ